MESDVFKVIKHAAEESQFHDGMTQLSLKMLSESGDV